MNPPKPGKPVRGSVTGRPIMAVLDLLGRRWTLRILWELRIGPLTFRELRTACDDISPSVLNQRVDELREAGVLANGEIGYQLTEQGLALMETLKGLHTWSERWADREAPKHLKHGKNERE